jgi:hypothetical protein
MTSRNGGLRLGLTALLLLSGVSAPWAQDAAERSTIIDGLEYRVEIGWHQRLVEVRRSAGAALSPFVSDGCSGGLSSGWVFVSAAFPAIAKYHGNRPPWESCCLAHDRLYHEGGPLDADASFKARRVADDALRQCVIQVGEERSGQLEAAYGLSRDRIAAIYRSIADVMYRAVRLGGAPCSGLAWRWGFGWPNC